MVKGCKSAETVLACSWDVGAHCVGQKRLVGNHQRFDMLDSRALMLHGFACISDKSGKPGYDFYPWPSFAVAKAMKGDIAACQ